MTPRMLAIYLDSFENVIKTEYETKYNFEIINAFHYKLFKDKKNIELKKHLLNYKPQVKKMDCNQMLDALKKCHLSFGGKMSDFN
jgi:hypothetical protein